MATSLIKKISPSIVAFVLISIITLVCGFILEKYIIGQEIKGIKQQTKSLIPQTTRAIQGLTNSHGITKQRPLGGGYGVTLPESFQELAHTQALDGYFESRTEGVVTRVRIQSLKDTIGAKTFASWQTTVRQGELQGLLSPLMTGAIGIVLDAFHANQLLYSKTNAEVNTSCAIRPLLLKNKVVIIEVCSPLILQYSAQVLEWIATESDKTNDSTAYADMGLDASVQQAQELQLTAATPNSLSRIKTNIQVWMENRGLACLGVGSLLDKEGCAQAEAQSRLGILAKGPVGEYSVVKLSSNEDTVELIDAPEEVNGTGSALSEKVITAVKDTNPQPNPN